MPFQIQAMEPLPRPIQIIDLEIDGQHQGQQGDEAGAKRSPNTGAGSQDP